MEQDKLREWEQKCIQEEAPQCTAACPLHMDARLFVKEMGLGNREVAFKVLAKSLPFPGILGRICDHPCELSCKRGEVEAPIAIGLLERNCVEQAAVKTRIQLLPRRGQKIAVIGSGLAGLTAAWDLLRKGFGVTVFERDKRLGGSLWEIPENILPRDVIGKELAVLNELKAEIIFGEEIDGKRLVEIRSEYDAVFIDRESVSDDGLLLLKDNDGGISIDPATGATSMEGIFAGGGSGHNNARSPVTASLQGRKGTLSIERFIQKARMDAGRENDGPYKSRLFTSIAGVPPLARILPAGAESGYDDSQARAEAQRCLQCQCLECVKACLYLERHEGYPKKYARQVFNNERVIYGAAHTKNRFVNSCSSCGLCETVCPNDFNMGDLCLQARRTMNEQKFMPASFHEFALQDMAHSLGEDFALSRHEAEKEQSQWLYFPSCQLCATSPGEVLSSYHFLRQRLAGGVGIMLGCCGAPAYWAGRDDLFQNAMENLRNEWLKLGAPKVITACSTCQSLFHEHLPGMQVFSLWKIMEDTGLPPADRGTSKKTVILADPCITRHAPETRSTVRRIIQKLGLTIQELPLNGDHAECCGYGGLMYNANPELARAVIERRLTSAADKTGGSANDYLAYCAMCRDNFAAAGQRVSHLIELLFPAVAGGDPAARGWITWSQRRTNRVRVRRKMRMEIDGREADMTESFEHIRLEMSEDVRRLIDDRRILEDDIRQVIDQAELSGQRLRNSLTGQYRACRTSENVTFWVDYTAQDNGFIIHNAYCHRMNIVGVKK